MNEWPTRVRTGVPPCSATISGTAFDVIRLWITVAPGLLASSRTATSAVIALGLTGSPRSSTTKQRSASPSKASPMSPPSLTTRFCRSTRLAGSSGHTRLDGGADRGEAGVLADRGGPRPAELDPVVLRGVVAGGEHRARHAQRAGGEVEHVGAREADRDGVEA